MPDSSPAASSPVISSTEMRSAPASATTSRRRVVITREHSFPPRRNGITWFGSHVVDDDETVLLIEPLGEMNRRVVFVQERRALAGERGVQLGQLVLDFRRFTERGPQDAVVERGDNVVVMTERDRQRGLAEAAGALERCGDHHRIGTLGVEQGREERVEILRAG